MIDLVLLRSFVTVVDTGNFMRVAEYLYLMQSTISQQTLRLGQQSSCRLLDRNQYQVLSTEKGDHLFGYVRRLLCLANEASEALNPEHIGDVLRLDASEGLDSGALTPLITSFAYKRPRLRLEVESGLSYYFLRLYRNGDLDTLFVKQRGTDSDYRTHWAEPVCWIDSAEWPHTLPLGPSQPSLSLVVFPVGVLYRQEMLRTLESIDQSWRITYSSLSLTSPYAAVSARSGVSLLSASIVQARRCVLGTTDGFPEIGGLELALFARSGLNSAGRALRDRLVEMCTTRAQTL